MKNTFYIFIVLFSILSLCSCSNEMSRSVGPKPAALGIINDIAVISDIEDWESMVGDTFQYYFASAFPILPEPEPFFDIRHFSTEEIKAEPLRRHLRTYVILCNLLDESSATTQMVRKDLGEAKYKEAITKTEKPIAVTTGKDKWARGQLLIFILGRGEDELAANIKNNFSSIAKRINIHDEEQLYAKLFASKNNLGFERYISDTYGINMGIPRDFVKVKQTEELFWIRKDTKDAILNIAFSEHSYRGVNDFDKSNMIQRANDFGATFITSEIENDFFQINVNDIPVFEYVTDFGGNYAKEIRGLWEMSEDFKGGPYIGYLIHDKAKQQLLMIHCFVFAPGKRKRDMMQQLDFLVNSLKFE